MSVSTENKLLVGKKAPAISLLDDKGVKRSLKDFEGQYILLYFYPRDLTPGCTTQACNFKEGMSKLKKLNLQVLGVSCDDVASHEKFASKYKLNFPLLADTDRKIVEKYGVWVEKSMYGKKYMGIQRDSFLIDPKGKIIKHYKKVKPAKHLDEVLADLKEIING